jgi:hypothetical protein
MERNATGSDAQRARQQSELRRDAAERQRGYRERALRLFPHVCASCGREFERRRLKELTVHHRDHNHDNNPPDGSNWELLCLYCHDHEHEKLLDARARGGAAPDAPATAARIATPFASLDALLGGGRPREAGSDVRAPETGDPKPET